MKKIILNHILFIVFLFFGMSLANANLTPISSVANGGDWNSTGTWIGGIIPTVNDIVEINGEVLLGSTRYYNPSIKGLLISSGATISSNYINSISINVNGDIVNNGKIKDGNNDEILRVNVSGNIINNGVWKNSNTDLRGTSTRSISGNPLKSKVIFHSNMSILGNPVFEKGVNFNSKTITLNNGNTITLSGSESSLLELIGEIKGGNLVFSGTGSYYSRFGLTSPKFIFASGSLSNLSSITLNGDIEIMEGAILQNNSIHAPTLKLEGNILNNGTIRDNPNGDGDYGLNLRIEAFGNIINNGSWENSSTHLEGTSTRSISGNPLKSKIIFGSDMKILNSPIFEKGVNFNSKTITLNNGNTITLSGSEDLSLAGEVKGGNLVFSGEISEITGNIKANKFVLSSRSVTSFGNINLDGDLEINDGATIRVFNALTISGSVLNNGTIEDNDSNFKIKIFGNIVNDGNWQNNKTYVTWSQVNGATRYQILFFSENTGWDNGEVTNDRQIEYSIADKINGKFLWKVRGILGEEEYSPWSTNKQINIREKKISITNLELDDNILVSGEFSTISWSGANKDDRIDGIWYDSVYLSSDDSWDIDDTHLLTLTHTLGLGEDETYDISRQVIIPGLVDGNYHIIIKTLRGDDLISSEIPLQTKKLIIDGNTINSSINSNDKSDYYSFSVTEDQNMALEISGLDNGEKLNILVSHEKIPYLGDYDYKLFLNYNLNEKLIMPETLSGTYYVKVYSDGVTGNSNIAYDIKVYEGDLFIASISPDKHGIISGEIDVVIRGMGFTQNTIVSFVDSNNFTQNFIPEVISSSMILLAFNVGELEADLYDVVVSDGVYNNSLSGSFRLNSEISHKLETNIILPSRLGRHWFSTIWVEYKNVGNTLMSAPVLRLKGSDNTIMTLDSEIDGNWFGRSGNPPDNTSDTIDILTKGSGDTPGTLKPGDSGRIPVYYLGLGKPWDFSDKNIEFNILTLEADNENLINWDNLRDVLKPEHINSETWEAVWYNFTNRVGSTWGDYIKMLSRNRNYLHQIGGYEGELGAIDLLEFELQNSVGLVNNINLAGDIHIFGKDDNESPIIFNYGYEEYLLSRHQELTLGKGWKHNWNIYIEKINSEYIIAHNIKGDDIVFRKSGDVYIDTAGYSIMADSNEITDNEGNLWRFNDSGLLEYVEIGSSDNNNVTLMYDLGKLIRLNHSRGQEINITYNSEGKISTMTDQRGTGATDDYVVTFDYDDSGKYLSGVIEPGNKITSYTYNHLTGSLAQRHALNLIEFSDNTTVSYEYDNYGRLIKSDWNYTNKRYSINYDYHRVGGVKSTLTYDSDTEEHIYYYNVDLNVIESKVNDLDVANIYETSMDKSLSKTHIDNLVNENINNSYEDKHFNKNVLSLKSSLLLASVDINSSRINVPSYNPIDSYIDSLIKKKLNNNVTNKYFHNNTLSSSPPILLALASFPIQTKYSKLFKKMVKSKAKEYVNCTTAGFGFGIKPDCKEVVKCFIEKLKRKRKKLCKKYQKNRDARYLRATAGEDSISGSDDCDKAWDKDGNPSPFKPKKKKPSDIVNSFDPNDKIAPSGYGSWNFIKSGSILPYQIRFENKEDVSAPAHMIKVYDILDKDVFDLETFELIEIGFADQIISVPPGYQNYETFRDVIINETFQVDGEDVMLNGEKLRVKIKTNLNYDTGELSFEMTGVDLDTGWLPENIDIGVLYPNDDTRRGEGYISYIIKHKEGLINGTEIRNEADIYFDSNEVIQTPEVLNIIDNNKPTSSVISFENETRITSSGLLVTWSGLDNGGSGIKSYDIYVSDNGGEYNLWLDNSTDSTKYFTGAINGHNYSFYSIATDGVGYEEGPKTTGDTSTLIKACIPPISGDWLLTESCEYTGNHKAPAGVIVESGVVLTIKSDAVLDIDFANNNLMVKDGGGVLVKGGGKIH